MASLSVSGITKKSTKNKEGDFLVVYGSCPIPFKGSRTPVVSAE